MSKKELLKKAKGSSETVAKESSEMQDCIKLLTKTLSEQKEILCNHKETLSNHENRISILEEKLDVKADAKTAEKADDADKADEAGKKPDDTKDVKTTDASDATQPQTKSQPQYTKYPLTNGPTRMYKFWDHQKQVWGFPKHDLFAAKAAGNGVWEPVWVWTVNGEIDHFLSKEEIIKYCP